MTPVPVHLDRHVLVGDFGRCREHLDIRYAAISAGGRRASGQRRVARRAVVAGGRRCREGHVEAGARRPRVGRPSRRWLAPRTGRRLRHDVAGPRPRRGSSSCHGRRGPRRGGDALEVAAGALHPWGRRRAAARTPVVAGHEQVGELVQQHVVEDVPGIPFSRSETRIVPSAGVHEAQRLTWSTPSAPTWGGRRRRGSGGRGAGARGQLGVVGRRRRRSPAARRPSMRVDPVPLLGLGEPGGDEDDRPAALPVGADGARRRPLRRTSTAGGPSATAPGGASAGASGAGPVPFPDRATAMNRGYAETSRLERWISTAPSG